MYCDLPFLRRCCFCVPLRPGLIVWGYLRLAASTVLIVIVSIIMSDSMWDLCHFMTSYITTCILIWSLLLATAVVDAIFQFILLMAAHTKNTKLMQSYLWYNISIFVVSNIVFFLLFVYSVIYFDSPYYPSTDWLFECFIIGILSAVLQFYIILLIRSEIRKQNNDCYVTFGNHDGNPKCFMSFGNPPDVTQDLQRLTIHDDAH